MTEAAASMLLSCPFAAPPLAIAESYRLTRLLDSKPAAHVAREVPAQAALVCLEGLLLQIQLMRAFVERLGEANVDKAVAVVRNLVDEAEEQWGSTSSEGGPESSTASADEAGAAAVASATAATSTLRARAIADAMRQYADDAGVLELGARALQAHYSDCKSSGTDAHFVAAALLVGLRRSRRGALEALAAAAASADGGVFVERLAALGGLAAIAAAMRVTLDESAQRAGLGILGHARLLDRDISRFSPPETLGVVLAALERHRQSPKLVGLAALALYNVAHRDQTAAAALVDEDGCQRLVDALLELTGKDDEIRASYAAGCWALGALAGLSGLRSNGQLVALRDAVRAAGADDLFHIAIARFEDTPAARNAILAREQLSGPDHRGRCALQ